MEREQMIEEILYKFCECHGLEDKCYDSGKKCADMSCAIRLIATEIVNKYIPDGAVVLTKNEYQHYCAFKIIEPQIKGCMDRERKLEKQLEQVHKETAREIFDRLMKAERGDGFVTYTWSKSIIKQLAKQYGVEVEE